MRKLTPLIFVATSLFALEAAAQDWKKELASPLVRLAGRKMLIEQHELCAIPSAQKEQLRPSSLQVKTRSEAPQGKFVSRDNFVAITTAVALNVLAQLGGAECKTLKAPIGSADLEISIQMTEEGFQVEYHDTRTGQKSRNTTRWEQLFAQ
jgi:hypothetical protein